MLTSTTLLCRLRGYQVPATPEERVRQDVIAQLFALGYAWHRLRCEVSHPSLGRDAGRADLVLDLSDTDTGITAFAIIECKAHRPTPTDTTQVAAYARAFDAHLWAVTNGTTWQVWTRDSEAPESSFPAATPLPRD